MCLRSPRLTTLKTQTSVSDSILSKEYEKLTYIARFKTAEHEARIACLSKIVRAIACVCEPDRGQSSVVMLRGVGVEFLQVNPAPGHYITTHERKAEVRAGGGNIIRI